MALDESIQAQIDKRFAEPDREAVRALLEDCRDDEMRMAILRLSRGQVKRVRDLVARAKIDYRDVLAWASQPTRVYIVGMLRKGPAWEPADDKLWTHLNYDRLRAWKKAGALVAAGPFKDAGDPRGLYIFTLDTMAEAQELTQEDEAIRSGKLVFEFHPWLAPEGLRFASLEEL